MIGQLPKYLTVNGTKYDIRFDFRPCLDILVAFTDPELNNYEKSKVALDIFYIDDIPIEDISEAYKQMIWFLDLGGKADNSANNKPQLYDWEQDEQIIFAAINTAAGYETRDKESLHFWTFMSYFYEIGDGTFASVIRLRNKLNKNERLDDTDKKLYKEMKYLVDLKPKRGSIEQQEIDAINKLLD